MLVVIYILLIVNKTYESLSESFFPLFISEVFVYIWII